METIMRGTLLYDSEDLKTSTHFEMIGTSDDSEYKLVYCMSIEEGDLCLSKTVTLDNKVGYHDLVEHGVTICMEELNKCMDIFNEVKSEGDLSISKDGVEIEFRRR